MAIIELGLPDNTCKAIRDACLEVEGCYSYPYHYTEAECLMVGDYDRWDLWDSYDEEAFGILPPIGYKEGEAL